MSCWAGIANQPKMFHLLCTRQNHLWFPKHLNGETNWKKNKDYYYCNYCCNCYYSLNLAALRRWKKAGRLGAFVVHNPTTKFERRATRRRDNFTLTCCTTLEEVVVCGVNAESCSDMLSVCVDACFHCLFTTFSLLSLLDSTLSLHISLLLTLLPTRGQTNLFIVLFYGGLRGQSVYIFNFLCYWGKNNSFFCIIQCIIRRFSVLFFPKIWK